MPTDTSLKTTTQNMAQTKVDMETQESETIVLSMLENWSH